MGNIRQSIMRLVCSRCVEIGSDMLLIDPKHIEISEKRTDIFNQLEELIPKEKRSLLIEFSDLFSGEAAVIEEIMYLQGLKDGMEMKDMLIGGSSIL